MGNFYTNLSVKSDDHVAVADILRREGRTAFVAPPTNGWVVVYDRQTEEMDAIVLVDLAQRLASELQTSVISVLNAHDDVLCVWLIESNREPMLYYSNSELLDGPNESPLDGKRLAAAC